MGGWNIINICASNDQRNSFKRETNFIAGLAGGFWELKVTLSKVLQKIMIACALHMHTWMMRAEESDHKLTNS